MLFGLVGVEVLDELFHVIEAELTDKLLGVIEAEVLDELLCVVEVEVKVKDPFEAEVFGFGFGELFDGVEVKVIDEPFNESEMLTEKEKRDL